MTTSVSNKLLVLAQYLVPARLLAKLVHRLSRIEQPAFKNILIRNFCRLYKVNTAEAAKAVPDDYRSFNEFFTRELQPSARPITTSPGNICCPVDGTIAQIGFANDGELIQAKGINYHLNKLLADDELAVSLRNSAFTTIYLAPYNYHRVHMPIEGTLEQMTHIPGSLYSVNAATTANMKQLYVRNERLVCTFRGPQGVFAVVLVGAMNVGSFSTAWAGEFISTNNTGITRKYYAADNKPPQLKRGDYLGHFNLGSTIIFVGPPAHLRWTKELNSGTQVQMGAELGRMLTK